jgi:hypothetical protein
MSGSYGVAYKDDSLMECYTCSASLKLPSVSTRLQRETSQNTCLHFVCAVHYLIMHLKDQSCHCVASYCGTCPFLAAWNCVRPPDTCTLWLLRQSLPSPRALVVVSCINCLSVELFTKLSNEYAEGSKFSFKYQFWLLTVFLLRGIAVATSPSSSSHFQISYFS